MNVYFKKLTSKSFDRFLEPLKEILKHITPLISRGDRPLQVTFEDQLKILIYYHLGEYTSGCHLPQTLEEEDNIASDQGIAKE